MPLIRGLGIQLKRHPDIWLRTEILEAEVLANDTDHFVRLPAERDRFADHVGRRAVVTIPESLADQDDLRPFWSILLGRKRSAANDWCAKQLERVRADACG